MASSARLWTRQNRNNCGNTYSLRPLPIERSRVLPGVTYSLSSELRQVRKIALTVFDRCHNSDFQDLMQPCSIRRLAARHNLVPERPRVLGSSTLEQHLTIYFLPLRPAASRGGEKTPACGP